MSKGCWSLHVCINDSKKKPFYDHFNHIKIIKLIIVTSADRDLTLIMLPDAQSDTQFAQYQAKRAALINQDRALRPDYVTSANHSPVELQADKIVRTIRSEEAISVWAAEHDDVPHPFPGMEFLTGNIIILRVLSIWRELLTGDD